MLTIDLLENFEPASKTRNSNLIPRCFCYQREPEQSKDCEEQDVEQPPAAKGRESWSVKKISGIFVMFLVHFFDLLQINMQLVLRAIYSNRIKNVNNTGT